MSAGTRKRGSKEVAVSSEAQDVVAGSNSDRLSEMAGHVLKPSLNAAAVLSEYTKVFGDRGMAGFVGALDQQIEALEGGDTSQLEAMLLAQAYSLQAIFMNLARRAVPQQNLKSWDTFMRMAFKAQNQSRMTLETLATLKNPPVLFARQANFAHGPQQVNNGAPLPEGSATHARKSGSRRNKLLEVGDEKRLEPGAPRASGRVDTVVAALESVDGPANRRGESQGRAKRVQGRDSSSNT